MPTINVPTPFPPATYLVLVAFGGLLFGQWAIGYFVPQRYRRNPPLTLPEQRRNRATTAEVVPAAEAAETGPAPAP